MTKKRGPRTTYDEVKRAIEALTKENGGERPSIRAIARAIGKNPSTTTIIKYQTQYYLKSARVEGNERKPVPANPLADQVNQIWEDMIGGVQAMEDNLRQDITDEWDRISHTLISKDDENRRVKEQLAKVEATLQRTMDKNGALMKKNGEQSKEIEKLESEKSQLIAVSNEKSGTIVQLGQECEIVRQEARVERTALLEKESTLQAQFRETLNEEKHHQRQMTERHEKELRTVNETRDKERAIAESKRAELQARVTGQESEMKAACNRAELLEQRLQDRNEQISELKTAVDLASSENKVLTQNLREKEVELRREVDAYAKRSEENSQRYIQSLSENRESLVMCQQENKQLREENERLAHMVANLKEVAGGKA